MSTRPPESFQPALASLSNTLAQSSPPPRPDSQCLCENQFAEESKGIHFNQASAVCSPPCILQASQEPFPKGSLSLFTREPQHCRSHVTASVM